MELQDLPDQDGVVEKIFVRDAYLGQHCLAVDTNLAQHRYNSAFAVREKAGHDVQGH